MAMIAPQSRANTLKLVDEEEIRRLMEQLVGRVEKLEAAENNRVVSPKIYSFFFNKSSLYIVSRSLRQYNSCRIGSK